MIRRKLPVILLSALLALTFGQAGAQGTKDAPPGGVLRGGKVTKAEKLAAAKRAKALGLKPGLAGKAIHRAPGAAIPPLPGIDGPGGTPHYFGPYANWANSPLPAGPIGAITLDAGGSGYANPLGVVLDAYGAGSGAGGVTFTLDAFGAITGIAGGLGGSGYQAPFVFIEDDPGLCGAVDAFGVPTQPACGSGAAATASLNTAALTGGIHKFVDKMPGLKPAGANTLITPNRLGLGPVSSSGQYIPVAVAENFATPALPFSDYYVIGLVEYYEKFHTDLPPTRLRGYVQLTTATNTTATPVNLTYLDGSPIFYPGTTTQVQAFDFPHYLGPVIVAGSNLPARVKFYNLLPPGTGGDLTLPVDETVMGSGAGPQGGKYSQNRATVHLHGNDTVWISDGTPHQWITPAPASAHAYPKGVSVRSVPDMPVPEDGAMTFYYTNAQSARLLFYHDHAMGITRLNVYAGEAAGYVITDQAEQDMIAGTNISGVNPGLLKVLPDIGIPLVIQDKSWTDPDVVFAQDPTWNWGTGPRDLAGKLTAAAAGDLWYPHVYMSAQNPWDLTGTNAFGRWHYGPWFVAPTAVCVNGLPAGCIDVGAVTNPFHEPNCDVFPPDPVLFPCFAPWEPPLMPGTPNPSMPGEAFMDTPLINGTAYPWIEVQAKPTRFRVLNAANDRFFNLQLYVAADNASVTTAGLVPSTAVPCTGAVPVARCTEVAMVPISVNPTNQYGLTPSGIPDATKAGPPWIQIGTEGGFLPAPVVVPQQPVGYNLNATSFNFGNVNQTSLALGPAERADVIVDFTGLAGQTLILYNDAPAAYPAGVSVYDYYTGDGSQVDIGGAPNTLPGYGPNIRTVAQIRVIAASAPLNDQVTLANLNAVFAKGPGVKRGVFEATQEPIIVPQAAYGSAYRNLFPSSVTAQYGQIADTQHTFQPINGAGVLQPAVTLPLETKGMHDEMGGVYDTQFGRMSGMLGLSNSNPGAAILSMYGYSSPPTDIMLGSLPGSIVGSLGDGTQIWRIFHNGVDTHPIHVHLFNAQLLNRIGQDGIMLPPGPTELGWKDTFKINPLEITFLAMKPIIPTPAELPFSVPNSVRLIDPTLPLNAPLPPPPPAGWLDPQGVTIATILNHTVNFGWEYVWHCHILAHEEMDMMHSLAYAIAPNAPTGLSAVVAGSGSGKAIVLNWTDNSANETSFTIQRANDALFTTGLQTFTVLPNVTTYSNIIGNTIGTFYFRVFASNVVGDTNVYAGSTGFPTKTVTSAFSNTALINTNVVPTAPSNVTVTGAVLSATRATFTVRWTDNATTETGFRVQWARNAAFTSGLGTGTVGANTTVFTTPGGGLGLLRGVPYYFRVQSFNAAGPSVYVNFGAPTPVTVP